MGNLWKGFLHPGYELGGARTHVRDEVQEGVAAQRADGQRHQEAEEELEEDSVHERDEDDAEQRQHADDGDGEEAADPRCNTGNSRFRHSERLQILGVRG